MVLDIGERVHQMFSMLECKKSSRIRRTIGPTVRSSETDGMKYLSSKSVGIADTRSHERGVP
jgi:hypothetical protein